MLYKSQTKATIRKIRENPMSNQGKSCHVLFKKKKKKSIKTVTLGFGNDDSDGTRVSRLWKQRCLPIQRL